MISDELAIWLKRIEREIEKLKVFEVPKASSGWVHLDESTFLTSTSWDGDAHSDTAKTLIDLSAVFGVPAGVKAVDVTVFTRDSASAANNVYLVLSPGNTANVGRWFSPSGRTNDEFDRAQAIIPCDANGDLYFQIEASGALTFDVYIQIWGYELP